MKIGFMPKFLLVVEMHFFELTLVAGSSIEAVVAVVACLDELRFRYGFCAHNIPSPLKRFQPRNWITCTKIEQVSFHFLLGV